MKHLWNRRLLKSILVTVASLLIVAITIVVGYAIEGALALGTRTWDEIAKEYEEILQGHADIFGG